MGKAVFVQMGVMCPVSRFKIYFVMMIPIVQKTEGLFQPKNVLQKQFSNIQSP